MRVLWALGLACAASGFVPQHGAGLILRRNAFSSVRDVQPRQSRRFVRMLSEIALPAPAGAVLDQVYDSAEDQNGAEAAQSSHVAHDMNGTKKRVAFLGTSFRCSLLCLHCSLTFFLST